jgi:hypothetical protein
MAASEADRDRTVRLLQESFIEGRLATGEFKQRMGQALVVWDFRELLVLTADLPVRSPFDRMPAHRITPRPPVRAIRSRSWLSRVFAGHRRDVSSAMMSAAGSGALASVTLCPADIESASTSPLVPVIGGAGS